MRKKIFCLSAPRVVAAIFAEFPEKNVDDVLDLLNAARLGREKLEWIFTNRFLVCCPQGCGSRRTKLYRQGGRFACSDCLGVGKQKLRYPPKKSVPILDWVRPLRMLRSLEDEAASGRLSLRRSQIASKKIARLRKTIPAYFQELRHSPVLDNHDLLPDFPS